MTQNGMDKSKYEELDAILEKLPTYEEYKKLNNNVTDAIYDDKCKDFVTNTDEVITLCKKFLRNIDNLASHKGKDEYKSTYFYLSHWIVDELGKIFTTNSGNEARQTIDKIIHLGNISHSEKNNRIYFIYNSDFDFKIAKEEKYLHDYFKNFKEIDKCTKGECNDYAKFVEYITTIYYEHKEDCLWWQCNYFIHDQKYDPDDLLLKLKGDVHTSDASRNNRGIGMSSEQLENPGSSNLDKGMIIKYMSCIKKNGVDGKFLGYICEDPAYKDLGNIYNLKCTNVTGNDGKYIGLSCNKTNSEQSSTGGGLAGKETLQRESQTQPTELETLDWAAEIFADSLENKDNSLKSGNIMQGVRLVSVYRDITKIEKELDKMETHLISENGGTNLISTLFPEVPKEYREKYKDEDIIDCKIYGRERNKLICKNTIPKNYEEKTNEQETRTNSINENVLEIGDEPDSSIEIDDTFDIFKSTIFRTFVMLALSIGILFVLFIYFKVHKNCILIYLYYCLINIS
ncbi:hypothetical protein PCYB_001450 [Plasmodium cynomolgi strain B]|uniref:CYIR protein n=1 Tax=Plasmodium cynomolgi (strain B) TaxID=1120755 RepID=K6VJ29_PLACD|nr:hypothetical protein PCYB_001450 [Plasmodium cynomolgi strain B]GAB69397.1 hypothetical protein PCYB_001450 [Plasmodium cynomolgi strain B]